jgi:hypothetical protein
MGWISHFFCADARISHFWFKFLTFPARRREYLTFMFQFLTFGLNFSLLRREHSNFSLLCLNFSLFARRHVKRWPAGTRQPVNDMVLTMSLGGPARYRAGRRHEKGQPAWEWAGRRGSVAGWESENFTGKVTKSEKFKHKSEKFTCSRRISEKFKPEVRNLRVRTGKVRNWNQKWEIQT